MQVMRSKKSVLFALVFGIIAGCHSAPPRRPAILNSHTPPGAPQAPPLGGRTPIAVPTAPVGAAAPVAVPVPGPALAVPATTVTPGAPVGSTAIPGPPPGAAPGAPVVPTAPQGYAPQQAPAANNGYVPQQPTVGGQPPAATSPPAKLPTDATQGPAPNGTTPQQQQRLETPEFHQDSNGDGRNYVPPPPSQRKF